MTDFIMTTEQKMFQKLAREFAEKEIAPSARQYDIEGKLNLDAYKKAVDLKLHLVGWPKEYGGVGLNMITQCIIAEELFKADAGFGHAWSSTIVVPALVIQSGTEEQKKYVADVLLSGGLVGYCFTDSFAGSDIAAITATATKVGDEYVINGVKNWVTNAPYADFHFVFAKTDPKLGGKGISVFIVKKDEVGLSLGKIEEKMGARQSVQSDVIFNDVKVPASAMVGGIAAEGKGFKMGMEVMNLARVLIGTGGLGVAQKALELSLEYAKERKTFGRPIWQYQAIQFMICDMEIQIQASRALAYEAARLIDAGQTSPKICACAKTMAGDTAVKVTADAVQVYSAVGYSRDYPVEKLMRDA
ncbi:MAG: acyl-CoA dehydrogenase family protein, partial [Anaerovoracaceae bacterium]|nr:acyl-CoA dehydrogenase family protein [Anaerovoracaceae bacterium]